MWGPIARILDVGVAYVAARRYGRFFGATTEADYGGSLYDQLRARLVHEARLTPLPDGSASPPASERGRRTPPTRAHTIQIDRGGEIVETTCNFYARGHHGRTLIVYHHGMGEVPNEISFRRLLLRRRGPDLPADLICYHATGHRSPRDVGQQLATLTGFATLVGDSLMGVRAIARAYRRHYQRVVYVGVSLGGIVGIVESALSASFDLNVSLIAHLDLVHCITETGFRHMVDPAFLAHCPRDVMRAGVDADRLLEAAQRRLVVINGIHDDYFRIELARAQWERFGRIARYEIPHGHISACAATRAVKRTLLTALHEKTGRAEFAVQDG